MQEKTPESTSSDYDAMVPYWVKTAAIMGGTAAMRESGKTFLPQFPHESNKDYELRLGNAKFTNIFADIVDTLAAKPFEQEITVSDEGDLKDLLEDIDGQGSHIHVFAGKVFHAGVVDALTWVMVDYPSNIKENATRAEVKASGIRPYWVHLNGSDVLAVYSEAIAGKEVITHVRIKEDQKVRDGYGEAITERVRVIERTVDRDQLGNATGAGAPLWSLMEKQKDKDGKKRWIEVDAGAYSIGYIPLFPFTTGKRVGSSWVVKPAMERAADLQIEHFQQESELKYMRQRTAFAMLAGNGVMPPKGDDGKPTPLPVGPFAVLYAPPDGSGSHGDWQVLEPAGTSLTFCSDEVDKTEAQLRELGRQPLTSQSGNITTITAAFAGDKANSAIEAWALNCKDFLENCLKATADWQKSNAQPVVQLNTDFSLDMKEDTGAEDLAKARDRGDISQETWFEEAKRRGYIGPNRTFKDEIERLTDELPGDDDDIVDG